MKVKFFIRRPYVKFIPLLLLVPIVISFFNRTLLIFPSSLFGNKIEAYTDNSMSGDTYSQIKDFSFNHEKVLLRFVLREGANYPDAFLIFWLDYSGSYLDLSSYKYLTLKISEAPSRKAVIFIKTYVDGISSTKHEQAVHLRHNEFSLFLSGDIKNYKIPLTNFTTPRWWFAQEGLSPDILKADALTQVASLDIHFFHRNAEDPLGILETLIIEEIAFHKDFPLPEIISLLVLGGYAFFLFKKRNVNGSEKKFPVKPLIVGNYKNEELSRLTDFINDSYQNPEISTAMVRDKTGIAPRRVFALIKEEYQLTFKQFINKIRLTEARRLLKETDRKVTEISLLVGFNDLSYFHKLFKQEWGQTPQEYRKTLH